VPARRSQDGKRRIGYRVPANDIEDIVVKSLNERLRSEDGTTSVWTSDGTIAELIDLLTFIGTGSPSG
jgi:hypothetical protein